MMRWILIPAAWVVFLADVHSADDWPYWRGPNLNGVAAADQKPVVEWSDQKNILWSVAVPGRGHSSPTIFGDKIVLTSADEKAQINWVLCYDRKTGKEIWKQKVNEGGFPPVIHRNNTHATPTVAFHDEALFAVFYHHNKVQLVALSTEGKILWNITAGPHVMTQYKYGYGPSPIVYKSTVIVTSECDGPSFIAAFDTKTGKEQWRTERPKNVSYSTPVIAHVGGKDQLLISGADRISSFDPANGKSLWSVPGITAATCGTMVWSGDIVFASGGYPKSETAAVLADGSGKVLWKNTQKCYEQSMLAHAGHLYAVTDNGNGFCWDAKTGEEKWKSRVCTKCSASPVLANGNIYITTERGETNVFKADSSGFQRVATNQLGDETFSTLAICGNQIFLRAASSKGGTRKETLYCIGVR